MTKTSGMSGVYRARSARGYVSVRRSRMWRDGRLHGTKARL
jgi:hypothetical protein